MGDPSSTPVAVNALPVSVATTAADTTSQATAFVQSIDPDVQQIHIELVKLPALAKQAKNTTVDQVPAIFQPLINVMDRASQRFSYLSCPPNMQSDWATFRTGLTEERALVQGISDTLSLNYTLANPPQVEALNVSTKQDFYVGAETLHSSAGMTSPLGLLQ
jgi:hypothetical protein